jgi:hypothetical protein
LHAFRDSRRQPERLLQAFQSHGSILHLADPAVKGIVHYHGLVEALLIFEDFQDERHFPGMFAAYSPAAEFTHPVGWSVAVPAFHQISTLHTKIQTGKRACAGSLADKDLDRGSMKDYQECDELSKSYCQE